MNNELREEFKDAIRQGLTLSQMAGKFGYADSSGPYRVIARDDELLEYYREQRPKREPLFTIDDVVRAVREGLTKAEMSRRHGYKHVTQFIRDLDRVAPSHAHKFKPGRRGPQR